jgi:hypothetical protein
LPSPYEIAKDMPKAVYIGKILIVLKLTVFYLLRESSMKGG